MYYVPSIWKQRLFRGFRCSGVVLGTCLDVVGSSKSNRNCRIDNGSRTKWRAHPRRTHASFSRTWIGTLGLKSRSQCRRRPKRTTSCTHRRIYSCSKKMVWRRPCHSIEIKQESMNISLNVNGVSHTYYGINRLGVCHYGSCRWLFWKPFQGMANYIPMLSLCRIIEIDLREMLGKTDLHPNIEAKDGILM